MSRIPPAALILAGTVGVAPLVAQDLSESILTATISQSFEVDDNLDLDDDSPGTSYFGDTRFALDLLQEAPSQRFTLGLDTGLRALWEAEEDFDFTFASPTTARAGFRQDWASGDASADLRYRQTAEDFLDDIVLDDGVIDDDPILDPDDLRRRERDTTERRYDGVFRLNLATDSPSSYSLGFQATRTDFDDDAADLNERTILRGDLGWTLRLNPVLSSLVRASYRYEDVDDAGDTNIRDADITVGLNYDVSNDLSVRAGVGYGEREERETVGGVRSITEDDAGLVANAGLTYQVDELISLSADGEVSAAAPDTEFSGALRAAYILPRGVLSARLAQDFVADSDGDNVRITRAGIGLTRELDAVSRVSFDASYGLQVNQDQDEPDITRADFTAVYSRDILADIFASIGYRFRYRDEDGSANSNAVFFTVGRSFVTQF